jgi:hypothetical protein
MMRSTFGVEAGEYAAVNSLTE